MRAMVVSVAVVLLILGMIDPLTSERVGDGKDGHPLENDEPTFAPSRGSTSCMIAPPMRPRNRIGQKELHRTRFVGLCTTTKRSVIGFLAGVVDGKVAANLPHAFLVFGVAWWLVLNGVGIGLLWRRRPALRESSAAGGSPARLYVAH